MSIEYKSYQVKSFDNIKGEIIGYGITYGNKDRVNDIILKGALQESIEDFNVGVSIKYLFEHKDALELNGNIDSIQDDNAGAIIKATISEFAKTKLPMHFKRIVEAFNSRKAFLSIGYGIMDAYVIRNGNKVYIYKDGMNLESVVGKRLPSETRYLEKIKAEEFSFTTNPANMQAKILDLKNINIPKYPVELSSEWNSELANQRWREYSNSTEAPSEMYKKAFLYYNQQEPNNFGSYHLQVVDIINGEPMINQNAVIAVYQVMQGARGGLKVVPSSEIPKLIAVVKELYQKINNVRQQENIELLPEPDFKMYEIEMKIGNIGTRAYAEKFCREHKIDFANLSESQIKRLVNNIIQVGYNKYKDEQEKRLDIQSNAEQKNIGSPSCETRQEQDAVMGQQIDWSKIHQYYIKQ